MRLPFPISSKWQHRRGLALVMVLILGVILLGMAGAAVRMAQQQTHTRLRYETYKHEFLAAETALQTAYAQLQFLLTHGADDVAAQMAALAPPQLEGYQFPRFETVLLSDGLESVESGQWSGLMLHRLHYRMDVTALKVGGAADRIDHPGASISQHVEITYIPLYLFAIFYDPVMEIAPGPFMRIQGRVHANGDMYVQSDNGLDFMAPVTVGGRIRQGRHVQSGQSGSGGDIRFSTGESLISMRRSDANGWLTNEDEDWAGAAQERWAGGLRDQSHGVTPLALPIPPTIDPHAIIERSDPANDSPALQQEKFENKAGLRIEVRPNGQAVGYDAAGRLVPLTYPDPDRPGQTLSIVRFSEFFDARENTTIRSIDIDLDRLRESGLSPGNGIVYVANERQQNQRLPAVRLVNGAQLPDSIGGGFTVACPNPVYVQGDYNTIQPTLALIAADAMTILSNAWQDARSSQYAQRIAGTTTVHAVCMQGTVPTADGSYSGGVENYFRLLEQWQGVDFNFRGSIINMWESQQARGRWRYGSPLYTAPTRNWSWDPALGGLNGPPGAPRVIELRKTGWEQLALGS